MALAAVAAPLVAQTTPECKIGDLGFPATVDGSLATSDCTLNDIVPGSRLTQRAAQYRFELTGPMAVRLIGRSPDFDPAIYLFQENYVLRASRPGLLGAATQAFTVHLPAGKYILVFSSRIATTGAFQLESSISDLRVCPPVIDWDPSQSANGELLSSGCRALDLTAYSTDESRLVRYRVRLARRGALRLTLTSTDFTPFLRMFNTTGAALTTQAGSGGESRILISLEAGTYTFWVNSSGSGTGAFRLATQFEDLRSCDPKRLAPEETVTAALANTDCRLLDLFVPSRSEIYIHLYTIQADRKSILNLEMKSGLVDTYLALGAGDEILFENDDSDGTSDSRIYASLAPEAYLVYATSLDRATGEYTITAKLEDQRPCDVQDVGTDQGILARLDGVECRVMDIELLSTDRRPADYYRLEMAERTVMSLALNSEEIDTFLLLLDQDGFFIDFSDDTGSSTNSKLEFLMPPGRYYLAATSYFEDEIGDYALVTRSKPPVNCPIPSLGLGATLRGELDPNDCTIKDVIPFTTDPMLMDQFSVEVTERVTFNVQSTSSDFPAALV
ncbi:MAG: hypothetical protein ACRD44_04740, partial [Bryobacteraceae bacterium]